MKNIKIYFLSVLIFLSSCAISPKVEQLYNFTPENKTIILLFDNFPQLRVALRKKEFDVLKYSYEQTVLTQTKKTNNEELSKTTFFGEAQARYAIELSGYEIVDQNIFTGSSKLNIVLEIIDIKTNQVIAYIENGGWEKDLFDKLAGQIDNLWKGKYKPVAEDNK